MFVTKPGKANYIETRAYCPISLSLFLLKMMDKLVYRYIRDEILGLRPYVNTNLPTNQENPVRLQCNM